MKINLDIKRPKRCQDCIFFESGNYGDMGATIAYVSCKLKLFKEDGRIIAERHKIHPFAFRVRGEKEKDIIMKHCQFQLNEENQS